MTMPTSRIGKKVVKNQIWEKTQDFQCAHCGKFTAPGQRTVDHFIPRSVGGGYDKRNLMPTCNKCNKLRGSEEVVAKEYYKYAAPWAIQMCEEYAAEWRKQRRNADGELWI